MQTSEFQLTIFYVVHFLTNIFSVNVDVSKSKLKRVVLDLFNNSRKQKLKIKNRTEWKCEGENSWSTTLSIKMVFTVSIGESWMHKKYQQIWILCDWYDSVTFYNLWTCCLLLMDLIHLHQKIISLIQMQYWKLKV